MKKQVYNTIIEGPSLEEFIKFHDDLVEREKKEKAFLAKCTQKNVNELCCYASSEEQDAMEKITKHIIELLEKFVKMEEELEIVLSTLTRKTY